MSGPGPARRPEPPPHTARTDPSIVPRAAGPTPESCAAPRLRAAAVTALGPGRRGVTQATGQRWQRESRRPGLRPRPRPRPRPARPRPRPARPRPWLAEQAHPAAGQPADPASCPSASQAPPPTYRPPRSAPYPVKLRPRIANLAARPGRQDPLQAP